MAKKVEKQRRSKMDRLAEGVGREFAHQNSVVLHSRMRVLEFEAREVEAAIQGLTHALGCQRDRRARIDAELRGLALVLERR